jgi:hypothetical protein
LRAKTNQAPRSPKALLKEALCRLYQPLCGAQPERFGQLLIELEQ